MEHIPIRPNSFDWWVSFVIEVVEVGDCRDIGRDGYDGDVFWQPDNGDAGHQAWRDGRPEVDLG